MWATHKAREHIYLIEIREQCWQIKIEHLLSCSDTMLNFIETEP